MSAPFTLNATELEELAQALRKLSDMRETTGVTLGYTPAIGVGDASIELAWDASLSEYRLDTFIGL